jgi:glycosyltransferase involved in cell wall biosynthesis
VKVTTLIMTYNHAEFIRQAIDSALAQATDFVQEIIISEDCSTDGTRQIVEEYGRWYPERIRLILSERNMRSNEVVARGIRAAKGTYVALLDADDYWLGTDKLQRQADFLDAHAECSMCFHNARVEHEDESAPWNWTPANQPTFSTLDDILRGNFIATSSTMFRRGLFEVPLWYNDFFPITDWPLHILNAEQGNIGYLDEVMGVYRYHGGGLYSVHSEDRKLEETLSFYQKINECLDRRLESKIEQALFQFFIEWVEEFASRGDIVLAKQCMAKARQGRPFRRLSSARRYIRNWLRLHRIFASTTWASAAL